MAEYSQPSFNVSIEEEYQFIDPHSRDLRGFATAQGLTLLDARGPRKEDEQVASPTGYPSGASAPVAGTPICRDVKQARQELLRVRRDMRELAASHGLKMMAAGAHPFSHWEREQEESPRYRALIEDTQFIARRLLAFGMYVHVGIDDSNLAVDVMNAMRYLLPHILCLANASPFWQGLDTGLASYRSVLLDALPRTGIPNAFRSHNDYLSYVDTLLRTNSIPDPEAIWWDIRPHSHQQDRSRPRSQDGQNPQPGNAPADRPALEIRVCDALPDVDDVLAVAALIQATVAWMVDLRHRNMSFRLYDRTLIAENKWRAVRYGLKGKLLDFGIEQEVPIGDLLHELLERVEPVLDRLNCREEVAHVHTIMQRGASSEQQRHVWRQSGEDGKAVVDFLVSQTEQSL
ncbi:MAG: YbdK family carboxylate-amine ligase [Caldilineaceae bacterium SB0661_bin_32]|uniref:Putative glutamate--cysteine ligase 2 n=1 Tax=Caldilineaceae bacterium SB0661_bin_32 TaxID=2605255 RepID=A0A6B1D8Y6_9CHLR|nr:YbdK family carboxylate-amine ligase [Caldilineaceae bacterium SB0661_bin_32]